MEKLSDKARRYASLYGQPPYGREIEGTAELLIQMADKLEGYKELEEQGKLLKLPCAVGDTVYRINKGAGAKLMAMRVQHIKVSRVVGTLSVRIRCSENIYGGEYNYLAEDIGRIVFLTREEAEDKLAEMEGKK